MKEVFIPKSNKKYSINEEGNVFSNYRYMNNGKKVFYKRQLIGFFNNKEGCKSLVVNLILSGNKNKPKAYFVTTLMKNCFKIKKPDNFHFYDLVPKDGNYSNVSLANLEYRIRTNKDSNYLFYPTPFYNKKKQITHKICANCGEKKAIEKFHLQSPKKEGENRTYRNKCESCRAKKQWELIKSDPQKFKQYMFNSEKYVKSDKGQSYYKNYRKQYLIKMKEILPIRYLAKCYRLNNDDLSPMLISLARKKIFLNRIIKQTKNEETS